MYKTGLINALLWNHSLKLAMIRATRKKKIPVIPRGSSNEEVYVQDLFCILFSTYFSPSLPRREYTQISYYVWSCDPSWLLIINWHLQVSWLNILSSISLVSLHKPPDPVELRGSGTANKEVDGKQVPVLGDNDQRVPGPDEAWWVKKKKTDDEGQGWEPDKVCLKRHIAKVEASVNLWHRFIIE